MKNWKSGQAQAVLLFGVVVFLTWACTSQTKKSVVDRPTPRQVAQANSEPTPGLKYCAAVRGNGELVMAHFASYAALTEKFGLFDAMAGGSSATISMFIYESILLNPVLHSCDSCDPPESDILQLRVSLLLKSLWEYLDVIKDTDEAKALLGLTQIISKYRANGIHKLLLRENANDLKEAQARLTTILESSELSGLINPDLGKLVMQGRRGAQEVLAGLRSFGNFKSDDPKIFFRPGILSFANVAKKIGRIANFYAGRGAFFDSAGMTDFLNDCAPSSKGKRWSEIKAKNPSCAKKIHDMITQYRSHLLNNEESVSTSRLSERLGAHLHILVSDAVLMGEDVETFKEGLRRFNENDQFDQFPFKVFDGLKYGLWAGGSEIDSLKMNANSKRDLKTGKRLLLESAEPITWETAISLSPAEPGLSRFVEIPNTNMISAGGWPDLAPTLALQDLGCQSIFYITRRGEDSPFAQGVAANLGMTPEQSHQLYDLKNPQSAFSLSLKAASGGVHCTNWDGHQGFSAIAQNELDKDAYLAPLITEQTPSFILGCSPNDHKPSRP